MSTIGVNTGNTEYDVAEALLDLSNIRATNNESCGENYLFHSKESLESAKLYVSYLIASNVAKPNKITNSPKVGTVNPIFAKNKQVTQEAFKPLAPPTIISAEQELPREVVLNNNRSHNKEATNKRSKIFKRKPTKLSPVTSDSLPEILVNTNSGNKSFTNKVKPQIKRTRDVGTQTEDQFQLPIIQSMEFTITRLCDKIKSLEEQIRLNAHHTNSVDEDISDGAEDFEDNDDESYKANSDDLDDSNLMDSDLDSSYDYTSTPKKRNKSNKKYRLHQDLKSTKILGNRNVNANSDDNMVPIGLGSAMIPARVLRHINWNSYTSATRKLLTAVFSRRILATHSLTGKPSPAFPNKPAKKKLDQSLVNDIVQTVVERCNVPENVVRTSITTKCADESKMYRTREQNKKKRKVNMENIPPDTYSDDF